jgi:hypothetical protein
MQPLGESVKDIANLKQTGIIFQALIVENRKRPNLYGGLGAFYE